jgi:hypothetical protein
VVQACRSSLGRRASALLIVVVDADMETTLWRASQVSDALRAANIDERRADEPIVVLIPKRHVETWIRALLGERVDEVTDYSQPTPTPTEIKEAAGELFKWTRPRAHPRCCVPAVANCLCTRVAQDPFVNRRPTLRSGGKVTQTFIDVLPGNGRDLAIPLQAVAPCRQDVPSYLAAQHNRVCGLVLGQPAEDRHLGSQQVSFRHRSNHLPRR